MGTEVKKEYEGRKWTRERGAVKTAKCITGWARGILGGN